ncbi:MAG: translation elongation factor Ts [bacterium]
MSVSATEVKKLRDKTGAGFMDCKKALLESNGDIEKAVDFLRKKGIASAKKREGKTTNEGIIMTYLHPGNRIGVMVEINCETDFVAKTDDFKQFAKNIAMQIAAVNPMAVTREDVPQELVDKEKEIFRNQALEEKKPEKIIDKIVDGKLEKFYQANVLEEQSFVKDTDKTVKEYLLEISGSLGENITIRRFVRYQLGE